MGSPGSLSLLTTPGGLVVREEVSAGQKRPEGATAAPRDVCLFAAEKVDAGIH